MSEQTAVDRALEEADFPGWDDLVRKICEKCNKPCEQGDDICIALAVIKETGNRTLYHGGISALYRYTEHIRIVAGSIFLR